MAHSNIQPLEFIGFEPTDTFLGFAKEKLYRVFGESPSDASARGFIRKTKKGYIGQLHVRSVVGTFMAEAELLAEDPKAVIEELAAKIRKQLHQWKKNRNLDQVS